MLYFHCWFLERGRPRPHEVDTEEDVVMNGTANLQVAGLVLMPQTDARAELDAWSAAIADLDAAMADLAGSRAEIEALSNLLDRMEASKVLSIEGPNAEARSEERRVGKEGRSRWS